MLDHYSCAIRHQYKNRRNARWGTAAMAAPDQRQQSLERTIMWSHVYDPLGNPWLSTLCAALPVIVLLGALGIFISRHILLP
jgi:hypothetical protein